jgi:hypothetical protein
MEWAADALNAGFYGWREGPLNLVILSDGERVGLNPGLNAGTAAVQALLAELYDRVGWERAVGPSGLAATYGDLFGDPFAQALEPLVPLGLAQPDWDLPWAAGETWFYSAGPHGGWGAGSAPAALDFLPPGDQTGCYLSPVWARAVAAGTIVRHDLGAAVLDVDRDGIEQTGWTVLYLHLAEPGKAPIGASLDRGDQIGRPSCDGGNATGTHLHVARRYNGVWISPAAAPFALGPWEARDSAAGPAGGGWLWRRTLEVYKVPCDCRADGNAIPRAP